MPAKSKQQLKYIFSLRDKYENKSNTPKEYKWIWDKEWENVDWDSLPNKVKVDESSIFQSFFYFISK